MGREEGAEDLWVVKSNILMNRLSQSVSARKGVVPGHKAPAGVGA